MSTYVKTEKEIDLMRKSGKIAALILEELSRNANVGVTSKELDEMARSLIKKNGAKSAFYGQPSGRGGEAYPAVLCTSVNETVVHGLPSDYILRDGDILSLDFGVIYEGYYSDVALTMPIGDVSDEVRRLIRATKKSLNFGIKKVRPGNTIGDIGNTIQRYVEAQGFQVVRDLVGHGIGRALHEKPEIPNYVKRHKGEELVEGMVIAIEPMVTIGSFEVEVGKDGFGYKTRDKSLSAHFEHTVAVTANGCEVLTQI